MGKPKYDYKGSVHHFQRRKDNNAWGWIIGILAFLLILAAI